MQKGLRMYQTHTGRQHRDEFCQYFVCRPLFARQASIRRGMELMRFWHNSGVISSTQTSRMACFNCSYEVHCLASTFFFNYTQQFLMQFKLGELPGHPTKVSNSAFWSHSLTILAVWAGAPSCWNTLVSLMAMNLGTLSFMISR